MKKRWIPLILAAFVTVPAFAQWSDYPACSKQYDQDIAACNKMKAAKSKKESCWASASQRLGYCEKHKGKTGFPALLNK